MTFHGQASVISHYVDRTFAYLAGWKIPVTGIMDIRLIQLFPVHKKFSIPKFNLFTLQSDHPFEEHHFISSEAHSHHIVSFQPEKEVRQLPAKIERSVSVSGFHAGSLNTDRNQDITEEKVREERNE